jgi:2-keto-4-pentenoate hydratase/2-oxohepta-3-ene-1,7-dioic acid hydratase in catechol pathway
VSEVAALGLVFGYACFNDGSVRDFQKASLAAGKNFERSGAFGPWIAPVVGAPAWDAMTVTTRLNGVEVQRGDTRAMIRGVPAIIAYLSRITTLLPGYVIATGTPSGVGAGRQPPLWMKPGDRVEVEIAGVGVLANQVIDQPAAA